MGLLSGIFGGGGGSKHVDVKYNPVNAEFGEMQFAQDLLKKKMLTDVTGLDAAGKVGVELNKQRLGQDLESSQAANQGATDTAMANASMYGQDKGGANRIAKAGLEAGAKGTQGLFANYANQNLATTQNNLQGQIDQQNLAVNNSMQTMGAIPAIKNQFVLTNADNAMRVDLANMQGRAMQSQADAERRGGLFKTIGTLGGAAVGGMAGGWTPQAMGLGAKLGGSL